MSVPIIYVDPVNGDDGTGDGSAGNPYQSIETGLGDATSGGRLRIADTGPTTLSAQIGWNGATGSTTTPIIMEPWVVDGTLTYDHPLFGTLPCFKIDGNSAVSLLFSTTSRPTSVQFIQAHLTGSTGSQLSHGSQWLLKRCRIDAPSSNTPNWLATTFQTELVSNYFVGGDGNNYNLICDIQDRFLLNYVNSQCTFSQYAFRNLAGHIAHNTFWTRNHAKAIIHNQANRVSAINNTFVGDGTSGQIGLNNVSGSDRNHFFNNIFAGLPTGIVLANSAVHEVLGYNGFYNNTANISNTGSPEIVDDLTANDVIESSDPFVDASGGDFMLKSTSTFVGAGYAGNDIGAQSAEASSGGAFNPIGIGSPVIRGAA